MINAAGHEIVRFADVVITILYNFVCAVDVIVVFINDDESRMLNCFTVLHEVRVAVVVIEPGIIFNPFTIICKNIQIICRTIRTYIVMYPGCQIGIWTGIVIFIARSKPLVMHK